MTHPVDFSPPYMPSTMKGRSVEWAVAWPDQAGGWQRGEAISEDEARQAATLVPGAVVISREVLGWSESPVYIPSARYDGSMDALVDEIVEQENSVLRSGLERGANIAVTHMETPRNRIAHRLSCGLVRCGHPIDGLMIQVLFGCQPMCLLDIRPLDVIGAQSIGLAMPARRGGRQRRRRRLAR